MFAQSSVARLVRLGLSQALKIEQQSGVAQQLTAMGGSAVASFVPAGGAPTLGAMRAITTSRLLGNAEAAAAKAAPPPPPPPSGGGNFFQYVIAAGVLAGGFFSYTLFSSAPPQPGALIKASVAGSKPGDYAAVKKSIAGILDKDDYDDGSYGPLLVRLAWHASGTYDAKSKTGGSNGATMRFSPESEWGANNGLKLARELLEPIKAQHPWISYADLWTLAGATAIEELGGPVVPWRPGRSDAADGKDIVPDGRLPDASQGAAHVRAIFGRMGFNDQEMVALIGAHALGRCHTDRSGYDGPWTNAPTTFSNLYFQELLNRKWLKKSWKGPLQYEDKESQKLMMLPADLVLATDRAFRKWTDLYAKDEDRYFKDFAAAFSKLLELGVPFPADSKYI